MISLTLRASFLGTSPFKPHVVFCCLAVALGKQGVSEPWNTWGILAAPALRRLARRAAVAMTQLAAMPIAWAFQDMHKGFSRPKTEEP